jgi:hypothetical protein
MTLSGPKNQSILLRIASSTVHDGDFSNNEKFNRKQTGTLLA